MLGCTVQNSGNTPAFYMDVDNFVGVAAITLNAGTFAMASGADNGLLVGSLLDGGTDNNGTDNVIIGNKTF